VAAGRRPVLAPPAIAEPINLPSPSARLFVARSNQWIHIFCVWPILFTAITLFAHIELPDAVMQHVPQNIIDASPVRIGNAGFVLAMLYFVWHFLLSIPIGFAANLLVVACLLGADYWHATAPADVTTYAWGVHIACWIAQFYGHGVHEHRRPALLENLFACEAGTRLPPPFSPLPLVTVPESRARPLRSSPLHQPPPSRVSAAATFMAPIFVVIEILCKLGFLADFHRDMSAVVEPEVRAFHAARLGKKEA